jgi:uncharacterized protein
MNLESMGLAVIAGAFLGIGAIYAERLLHHGFDVLLVARKREGIAKTGFRQIERVCHEMRVVQGL